MAISMLPADDDHAKIGDSHQHRSNIENDITLNP